MSDKRVFLTKHSPAFWRVTLNHPPLNIFGPKTIPQLNEVITAIETDKELKIVVFDSAIDGFFMTHYDFVAKVEETTSLLPGPTGLAAVARFPNNDRTLTDDVVDLFFSMYANREVTDKVGPHDDL